MLNGDEKIYVAEIFALLLNNMEEYRTEPSYEQREFMINKLSYFGYDFDELDELDELYELIFNEVLSLKTKKMSLKGSVDDLYRDFLTEYYLSYITKGHSSSFLNTTIRNSISSMGCHTK